MTKGRTQTRDASYMREAIRIARKGLGRVSPNPMVGALVVRGETIVGRGYHRDFGGPHAEVNALNDAKKQTTGATLYVTLEPCSHYGKTPPCVDLIIEREIGCVVVGTMDPNPAVGGTGIRNLKDRGVDVAVGILENECRRLNEAFFKFHERGIPLVTLKMAQSLDGRIATASGDSQWISSPDSLKLAHRLRATHDSVMVGIGTVISDDPSLTVRLVKGKNPLRVVVDSRLRIPLSSKLLSDGNASHTIVLTTDRANPGHMQQIENLGARVLSIKRDPHGEVDMEGALRRLASEGIMSVLVEGGAGLATSFLKAGLIDKLILVIGPKIIGKGVETVGDLGISDLNQALGWSVEKTRKVGEDLVIVARPDY
ncbi:MAG: bifunctional diaminohydroxyphosphoribosylaminopyrimidine deaminase/5-amino-6-(5-phosphoribosylamino)uracil reductase RibD [Proteobacteria bacterium]|nr:bifunctional diaminohydroxyphosphoribosylaminopyrimidine deaminase/5-amino-6-(5-phosphoribosylamino)uracil reductase RibD [Pseudomonadota bacterium]NIS68613.1 bifunctional diaminohydroxyphosphoribosylaminopyrimidine deaminase/5-amino-6-(5-phosphoribosylamino)uracil reductase RibD [Pseudomonadota bacterium]